MRTQIRICSLCIIAFLLISSVAGCKSAPSASISNTPAPGGEVSASAADTTPEAPSPEPEPVWRPVAEEDLSPQALDAWMDMRIMIMNYAMQPMMRAHMEASFPVVPSEVADAMAWEYIESLREYVDNLTRYVLNSEMQENLLFAYQGDGQFDRSALGEAEINLLNNMEGLEIDWVPVEGMLELEIRYDWLRDWMTGCSPAFLRYLDLMAMDSTQKPAVDGALQISYTELGERTVAIEDFLKIAQGTPFQNDIEELYLKYLELFLSGADYPSVLDMQLYYESDAFAMTDEAKAAFRHIMETAPGSATAAAVEDWQGTLSALIESGVTGESAYQQLWDDFAWRVAQYASAAGVRIPRVFFTVSTQTSESDIFSSDMQYPVLYGDGIADGVLANVENWISADIDRFRTEIEDMAAPDYDYAIENGFEFRPYAAYSRLRLTRAAGPVISIVADMEQYTGGAHGLNYRRGYNFDPVTGEEVELSDLFKADTDPWELLEAEVTRQIGLIQDRYRETQEDTGYLPYDQYAGINPDQAEWYVTDEGIVVIFQQYEIGPYAIGIPEFTVPWWRLREYLR